MQYPTVSVDGKMLLWAIRRSGKSIDKLAESQQMKNLKDWIDGKKDPTVKQLEAFATATYVPFGYLFFSNPPDEQIPIPYHRTIPDSPATSLSADMIDTIQIIEHRQDWMRGHLIGDGAEPLDFVGSAKLNDLPETIAHNMRKKLGIDQKWASAHSGWGDALTHMLDRIEDIGIFLSVNGVVGGNNRRPLNPYEFRGFVMSDVHAPFIFVNNRDIKSAQMFTISHGLAHVWMGKSAAFDLGGLSPAQDEIERVCNRIAAEFLVPTDSLNQRWVEFSSENNPYQAGAHHFKVSELVVARRALDARLINQYEFRKFYQREYREWVAKGSRGGEFYNTAQTRIGKRFLRNVINAVGPGGLLYREAYSLTGLNRKTFDGMMDRIKEKGV